ncbi:MAG: preprotein translocase subunit YajC [Gammaproteobacteria bacterium]|jgi:preprotein translocase subunit YajC|nr:preprotein translocase subunit YajC [Gammaproteobacteria bacterium]
MDYLIPNAWAQAAGGAPPGGGLAGFLPLAILFLVFYMFLIRPQMKRQKEHAKMVRDLAKGDEAVTTGGLLGRVTEVGNNFVKLEVAKDTEVKVQKHAIAQVMPKGTLKEM